MSEHKPGVTLVPLPPASMLVGLYPRIDLTDSYATQLPLTATSDPETLARFMFSQRSRWMDALMRTRDAIVGVFGLKTAAQLNGADAAVARIAIFRIYTITESEILLGEDDTHLDFRLSVLCRPTPGDESNRQVIVSTVVHCHNTLGRTYLAIIAPFHRLIVKSILARAARRGWPDSAPNPV